MKQSKAKPRGNPVMAVRVLPWIKRGMATQARREGRTVVDLHREALRDYIAVKSTVAPSKGRLTEQG